MNASTAPSGLQATMAPCVLLGLDVQLEYIPVGDEVDRRAESGLGAICDRELLSVLFALPADLPVPRRSLTDRQLRLLRRSPDGAADITRSEVTRRVVPTLRVRHVTFDARPTVANLRKLSTFGPFTSRTLRATAADVGDAAISEAGRLGITIAAADGRTICDGARFTVHRHTAATWLFLEQAAAAIGS